MERMVSPAETPGFTRPVMDERHLVYGQMQRDETPGHAPRPGSEGTLLWEIQARTLLNSRPHKCVSHKTMEVIHKMTGRVCLGSRLAGTQMWQEPKNDSCPKSWLANMFRRKLDITILYIYILRRRNQHCAMCQSCTNAARLVVNRSIFSSTTLAGPFDRGPVTNRWPIAVPGCDPDAKPRSRPRSKAKCHGGVFVNDSDFQVTFFAVRPCTTEEEVGFGWLAGVFCAFWGSL